MQRSSVDLPEPEAPISATASCSATVRSIPAQDLALAVGLGDAAQLEHRRLAAHISTSAFCGAAARLHAVDDRGSAAA